MPTTHFYSPAALAFILANTTIITHTRKYTHVDTRTLLATQLGNSTY